MNQLTHLSSVPPLYAPTVPILGPLAFYQAAGVKYANFLTTWYIDSSSVAVSHQVVQSARVANDFDLDTLNSNTQLVWTTLETVYSNL